MEADMEDYYEETHQTWNELAQAYADKFMDLDLYDQTYHAFCDALLESKPHVLELGCGPGNISKHLVQLLPDMKLLATDVSQKMVDMAARLVPDIETKVLDCRDIGNLDKTFDGIVGGFVIPYLTPEDLEQFIIDSSKVLKHGGVFYLSFVDGDEAGWVTGSTGMRTYFAKHPFHQIENACAANELKILRRWDLKYETENKEEFHTVVIFRKEMQ